MTTTNPTHAITDSKGVAVKVGNGEELLPLLQTEFPYANGFRLTLLQKADGTANVNSGEAVASAVGAERTQRHEAQITELLTANGVDADKARGFAKTKTAWGLAAGTTLVDIGKEKLASSFNRHLKMGKLVDHLEAVATRIDAENRVDITADLKDLAMLVDGRLIRVKEDGPQTYVVDDGDAKAVSVRGGGPLEVEEQVFGSLSASYEGELPRAASLLAHLRPDRRARVFNGQVGEFKAKAGDDTLRKLRTRNGDGPRSLFGIVGPDYRVLDGNTVARIQRQAFLKQGLGELRGETVYNQATTVLRTSGTIHADPKFTVDFGAGDIFEWGVWTKTGDIGNSGITGGIHFRRNGCLNLIVVYHEKLKTFSIHHKGSMTDAEFAYRVETEMSKLATMAVESMEIFQRDWGVLRNTPISKVVAPLNENDRPLTAAEAIKAIASERSLDRLVVSVKARRELVPAFAALQNREEVLVKAFGQEPGDSAADVVNAVTRAWEFVPADQRGDWEVAGGMLSRALAVANA